MVLTPRVLPWGVWTHPGYAGQLSRAVAWASSLASLRSQASWQELERRPSFCSSQSGQLLGEALLLCKMGIATFPRGITLLPNPRDLQKGCPFTGSTPCPGCGHPESESWEWVSGSGHGSLDRAERLLLLRAHSVLRVSVNPVRG